MYFNKFSSFLFILFINKFFIYLTRAKKDNFALKAARVESRKKLYFFCV